MADDGPVVAVGLLTAREVQMLGASLKRVYPVADTAGFDDLLAALDGLDPRATDPGGDSRPGSSVGDRFKAWRGLLR